MSLGTTQTYAEKVPRLAPAQRAVEESPQPGVLQTRAVVPSLARSFAAIQTPRPVSGTAGKARIARSMQQALGNARIARLVCVPCGPGAAAIQRQGPPAALTDEQKWEQDWNDHPEKQGWFRGNDRPKGTPRQRYDVLCPLYKAHGIPRPMLYLAAITTVKFYNFSFAAHNAMQAPLTAAETTLKAKGHATAPVSSMGAFNARTTSKGGWSNHAAGKAVDIDPDINPHITEQKERKIISLVTGVDMEKGGQGYDVMKGASDRFKADYNPAGMQRRITELSAVEKTWQAARDMLRAVRDMLKAQRDGLKAERADLKKQLKSVPQGKKATADDAARAAALKTSIQQKEADLKQVDTESKANAAALKKSEAELKAATGDRELLEKQLASFQATEKAIQDLENAVTSLPDEIKTLEGQIAQSKQDEADAKAAKNAAGVRAEQKLRAKLQQTVAQKKGELKKKETQLDKKKKQRDADPLRRYAAGGFLNLPKDVVEALTGAGLKWGGNWQGAKDFMHFEL